MYIEHTKEISSFFFFFLRKLSLIPAMLFLTQAHVVENVV